MENIAIIGNCFGDEGKGRIVQMFAPQYKYIVRTGGSSNCGHTLYYNGIKAVRHLVPSADFRIKEQFAFLGSGMVINPDELLLEVKETESMFPGAAKRIIVDPDAFAILPEYLEEDKQNVKDFGSTGKGVSVAYRERIYRKGTKLRDLLKDNHQFLVALKEMGVQFKYNLEMYDEFSKAPILFEGAQSVLLDPSFGTYPFVTSGECTPAGIFNAGFSYAMPKTVYGILKAYSTRVGAGPFPTELSGQEAHELREMGKEYGATTGRPRRVGWLDLPALKYAIVRAGITNLVITKLDILNGMKEIPYCDQYIRDGKAITPVSGDDFFNITPSLKKCKGWDHALLSSCTGVHNFVNIIEEFTGTPVSYISAGVNETDIMKWE